MARKSRREELLAAALVAFLAGYAWATRRFLARDDDRPVPGQRQIGGAARTVE